MKFVDREKSARLSLALVCWVVLLCLGQNVGAVSACELKYQAIQNVAQDSVQRVNSDQDGVSKKCDLSEHLIQVQQHHLDDVVVTGFIFAFVLIAWLLTYYVSFQRFTEPIPYKGRLHLTFCVFRE